MYDRVGQSSWRESSVYDLAIWKNGLAFKNIDFSLTGRPVIKIAELKSGITAQTARTNGDYDPSVSVRAGDLLFSWSGNPDTSIDVFRWDREEGWLNQHIFKVTPRPGTDEEFLFFVLRWLRPRFAEIARNKQTTGLGHVTIQDLKRMVVGVPDLAEQRRIVSTIGPFEYKIELNRRMNETLEAIARAIFKDWFVDFGPTRAKMEGRAPYLAPDIWSLFPDRLDDKGRPEGWEFRRVGDFAELRGGKQLEKERITSSGSIPVFGGAGVMGFTDEHNADGFVISVGRVGAYCGQFFSHRGKAWINNNASLIRQFEGVSGEWLFQSLRHADIEVIKKGAAQPFVSNTDVGNMPIIWPGERVVAWFADVAVPLMLRMEHNDAEASTLTATRDFLLPKLMSGEFRVGDTATLA